MHNATRQSLGALLAAIVLATLPGAADAQWRWRDAAGQVNASDRPPPKEIPDKDILSRPTGSLQRRAAAPAQPASAASAPAVAVATAASASPLQAEVEARRRRGEQEQAARAKVEADRLATQRANNCQRARAHVATLETGQRVARTNARGEREILDDKGRDEEMRAARAVIVSDCR